MTEREATKAVVKNSSMEEEHQLDAVEMANIGLRKFSIENDVACFIKKEFDKKYKPTWHCIVGRRFGSSLTFEQKHMIFFYIGQVAILLWKT